jgi:hypothetical protein
VIVTMTSFMSAILQGDTGIPGLRHFLYMSRTNVQFTMPEMTEPYTSQSARKRLLRQYHHVHERMHRKKRPLKLLYHVGEHETMLGWVCVDESIKRCLLVSMQWWSNALVVFGLDGTAWE